ncbi:phage tail spike protein [Dellaglioa sp. BT-FLS60]
MSGAILYAEGTTDFSTIGLGSLGEMVTGTVTQARNGQYDMTFTYPRNGFLADELKTGAVVIADTGHNTFAQKFDIQTVTKSEGAVLEVYATHISYRQMLTALKPNITAKGTAQTALNAWKSGHVEAFNGTVLSNITTNSQVNWQVGDFKTAREALGGVSGSLLDIYGGEFIFDNENVSLMSSTGKDSGVTIAYGKNLVSLEQEDSIESTWTSIYPYSKKTDNNVDTIITLPKFFIDSENASKFSKRRIQMVDFSQDESVTDIASLEKKATAYMKSNGYGIPKVSIKTTFLDLSKTVEFNQFPNFEKVSLCDTVHIYFEDLDIDTKAKIITTDWNILTDSYDSLEIGDASSNMTSVFKDQEKDKQEVKDHNQWLENAINNATDMLTNPSAGNVKFLPNNTNAEEIVIMDTADIATAKKVWRWNSAGLGYSKNGYSGPYETAMTSDGAIVANMITAGTLKGINIEGVTFKGSDMFLENGLEIGKNGGVTSTFDAGETGGNAFQPRWWKGKFQLNANRLGYQADEYNVLSNGTGPNKFTGYTENYFGPNYGKWRRYDNKTDRNLLGRVDITGDVMQISDLWRTNSGVLLYSAGDIEAYKTIYAHGAISSGNIQLNALHTIKSMDGGTLYFNDNGNNRISINAKSFIQGSKKSLKKNFADVDSAESLEMVDGMNILNWNYNSEESTERKHIGLVIDDSEKKRSSKNLIETPKEVLADDGSGVDLNNLVGLLTSAVQELSKENKALKERVEKLEEGQNGAQTVNNLVR